ncbi:uncharacterized protein CLUP02_10217 [Colletotrichum lupini]|uniref:Uncharacterized protein n=1 Tax=Colletotrichum lupini TaxID=145971 RepID=A0A9Q8SW99_9PEZI|nr:uncharacterized protein CLUP02_10217 [Colletotrichum lupini]UQC84721.1 hypothetical protein CLUP02_10217 [Colletotrichum lupini]
MTLPPDSAFCASPACQTDLDLVSGTACTRASTCVASAHVNCLSPNVDLEWSRGVAFSSLKDDAPLVSGTQRKRLHFGVPQNLPLPIVSAFSPQITPENTWMSNSVLQRTSELFRKTELHRSGSGVSLALRYGTRGFARQRLLSPRHLSFEDESGLYQGYQTIGARRTSERNGQVVTRQKSGTRDATQMSTIQRHPGLGAAICPPTLVRRLGECHRPKAYLMPFAAAFYNRLIRLLSLAPSHWTSSPADFNVHQRSRAAASGDGGNEHQPAVQCDESKLAGSTLWPAASRHISLRVLDGLSNYGLKWTTTSVVQHWPGQVHATHFMSRPPALSRQALAPLVHPVPGGGVRGWTMAKITTNGSRPNAARSRGTRVTLLAGDFEEDLSHKGFLGSNLYPKNTARTRAFAIIAPHWMLLSGCILEPDAWLSLSPQPSAMTVSGFEAPSESWRRFTACCRQRWGRGAVHHRRDGPLYFNLNELCSPTLSLPYPGSMELDHTALSVSQILKSSCGEQDGVKVTPATGIEKDPPR